MKLVRLIDIAVDKKNSIVDGPFGSALKSSDYVKEGVPVLQGKNITGNKFRFEDIRFITEEKANKLSRSKVKIGDYLLVKIGSIGYLARIDSLNGFDYAIIPANLAKITINEGKIYALYFEQVFKQPSIKWRINRLASKTAQPALSLSKIKNFDIPIPDSYSDQIKIATLLSKAEMLIKQRKESIDLLDEFLKSTFLKMFGDIAKMKKSKLDSFGNYIEFITSGSRGWAKYYSNEGAKFLRIQNVWKASLRLDDLQFVNVPDSQEANRTRVQSGDLLLSITADLGRTAVVPRDFGEAYINQHLVLIRLNKKLNPLYAAYFFFMPFGYSSIQGKNKAAVKAGLNFNDIRSLEILVPAIELQNQFAAIVEKSEALKAQFQNSLADLENLYASLSQRAFKGALDLSAVTIDEALLEATTQESLPLIPFDVKEAVKLANKIIQHVEKIQAPAKMTASFVKQLEQWNNLTEQFKKVPTLPDTLLQAQKSIARIQETIYKTKTANTDTEEGFNWATLADRIKTRYKDLHFNFEMLINFMQKHKLSESVQYYASEELKANPRLNDAEDLKTFIQSAVQNVEMDEKQQRQTNPFLQLTQSFYNAEEENFSLSLHKEDFTLIKNKEIRMRSGIYFRIASTEA